MAVSVLFFGPFCISALPGPARADNQESSFRHMRHLYYENSSGERCLTTFDYDERGCPGVAVWEQLDRDRWSLDSLNYDDRGNLVRRYREYSDGVTSEELYEYDAAGRRVNEKFSRSDGVTGTTTHEYDRDGNPTESHCSAFKGWFNGKIVYSREHRRKTGAEIYQHGERVGEIRYDYDAAGRLEQERWQLGDSWSQTFTYVYFEGGPARHNTYTSPNVFITPKDSFAVAAENYDYSGQSGGLITNTVFLYDPDRRLSRSYRIYADGRHGVFSYEFNVAGKLAERTAKVSDGGTGSEIYEYDKEGRLVSAYYKNFDCWLTGKILFKYAGGRLSKGVFKGENGSDAVISFGYDDMDHLASIHWEFSSGKTQTYTFEYAHFEELPTPAWMKTISPADQAAQTRESEPREDPEELSKSREGERTPVIFVCSASSPAQLERVYRLAESIRAFAGRYRDAPIWVFGPEKLTTQNATEQGRFASLNVALKRFEIPDEAGWYYLSGMVFAAAEAERQAAGKAAVLVFMGSDTIVLEEPSEFVLPDGISLGYCPVMHKNISPLYTEPLDAYWSRAYSIMNIDESAVFKMITPADGDVIRPYFNAGCLSTRPERGLFRKWAATYIELCRDSLLKREAEKNTMKRVFTFQVALTGVFLNNLGRDEMMEFSKRYNYPIFFKEMYGAKYDFHDITNVVTIRYEDFFEKPLPDWDKLLDGPPDRIAWIKEHCLKD
jgi:YD repeat-containing protein